MWLWTCVFGERSIGRGGGPVPASSRGSWYLNASHRLVVPLWPHGAMSRVRQPVSCFLLSLPAALWKMLLFRARNSENYPHHCPHAAFDPGILNYQTLVLAKTIFVATTSFQEALSELQWEGTTGALGPGDRPSPCPEPRLPCLQYLV